MKKLLLALVVMCQSFITNAGVISGGGGDIEQADPVRHAYYITNIVRYNKPVLVTWLYEKEKDYLLNKNSESPIHENPEVLAMINARALLFESDINVYQALDNLKIYSREDKPCFDENNNETDASFYTDESFAICISPFTMQSKLNEYNFADETLALVIHELSHLIGANEEEAEILQGMALYDLNQSNYFDIRLKIANMQYDAIFTNLTDQLSYYIEFPNEMTWRILIDIQNKFWNLKKDLNGGFNHHSLVSADNLGYLNNEQARINHIRDYLSIFRRESSKDYYQKLYDQSFGDEQTISYSEYFKNRTGDEETMYGTSIMINKINQKSDITIELKELKLAIEVILTSIVILNESDFEVIADSSN